MTSVLKHSIIGISGKQYSGKDTLAEILLQALPEFHKIPIAFAIKQTFANQHHLSLEAVESRKAEFRSRLIELGDWGRKQNPDYWLKEIIKQPNHIIVSDVRLKHEYDFLKRTGAFLIRLEANHATREKRGLLACENDPTETDLDNIQTWSAVLTNNSTKEALQRQVDALLPRLYQ